MKKLKSWRIIFNSMSKDHRLCFFGVLFRGVLLRAAPLVFAGNRRV